MIIKYVILFLQCEGLLELHEENIIKHFVNMSEKKVDKICSQEAKLCSADKKPREEF